MAIVGYVDNQHHAEIDLSAVHSNRIQIFGVSNAKMKRDERAEATRGFVRDIMPAIESGRITPLVDSVFPFDDLPAAKARMDANQMTGKIVVTVAYGTLLLFATTSAGGGRLAAASFND